MFAKFILTPVWQSYTCTQASNTAMGILGSLLADDVKDNPSSYKQTLQDDQLKGQGGNFTLVAKEKDHVLISDLYSEEEEPTELKISIAQFIQLLDDWQEKVCKRMPKEVVITEENGIFTIETIE